MSSNSNQIRPLTAELPALERLENQCIMFLKLRVFILEFFLSMNGAYAFQKLTRIISKGNNLLVYNLRDSICSALFLALTLFLFLFGLRLTMYLYHCGNLLPNRNGARQTFVSIRMHFRDRSRGFAILEICSLNLQCCFYT